MRDVQPQITRFTDRLASYLTLAGLTAVLLIGGVGVVLAIQNYLAGKTTTIAILKCLGASSGLVFRVYLMQVLSLAGAGILMGLGIGLAAPWLLQALAAPLLPIQVVTGWYPLPLLIAGGSGPADRAGVCDLAAGARPRGSAGGDVPRPTSRCRAAGRRSAFWRSSARACSASPCWRSPAVADRWVL